MPHTVSNLWDRVIDFENIYQAYRAAKKGRRYRSEALRFTENLEENLIIVHNELEWLMYRPLPHRQFYIHEPKKRLISAPAFRDRIVHHALVQIVEPVFENRFINTTFACRTGFGTHAAMMYVHKCARAAKHKWNNYYVLKCDISGFFANIDQDILKKIIRRTIRDERILHLLDIIIRSHESSEKDGKGVPIGALTSQLMANIYLDPLDHFIKEHFHTKYYARYMDDFIIIHYDKNYLYEILAKVETFLRDKLQLNLNPKTGIFPGRQGIDFCGYRIWPTHIKPRKSTVKRAKKRLRKMAKVYQSDARIIKRIHNSIQSFLGYIKHCSGRKTTKSLLENIILKRCTKKNKEG